MQKPALVIPGTCQAHVRYSAGWRSGCTVLFEVLSEGDSSARQEAENLQNGRRARRPNGGSVDE